MFARVKRRWTEVAGYFLAAALLMPIAIWLKQSHFIGDWLRAIFQ